MTSMLHFKLIFQGVLRVGTTASLSHLLHVTHLLHLACFTPNCPYDFLDTVLTSCGLVCDVHQKIFQHTGTGPPSYPWGANKVTGHTGILLKIWALPSKQARPWLWETDQPRRETHSWLQRRETHSWGGWQRERWIQNSSRLYPGQGGQVTLATLLLLQTPEEKKHLKGGRFILAHAQSISVGNTRT